MLIFHKMLLNTSPYESVRASAVIGICRLRSQRREVFAYFWAVPKVWDRDGESTLEESSHSQENYLTLLGGFILIFQL